jgi:hypothetical protein
VVLLSVACGKEGPPLPPLQLAPAAVTNVAARRQANEVRFTFVLPTRNQDGSQPVSLERVEIFAATVAAGAVAPTSRELLAPLHRAGAIDVKPPPPKEGEEPEKKGTVPTVKKDDPRPGPGDSVTFVEELTEARLKPTYTTPMPAPKTPDPAAPPTTPPTAAPAAPPPSSLPKRVYAIRGVARGGRPGQPTTLIELPLVDPPPPPGAVTAKFTASAITLSWVPPVVDPAAKAPPSFNVYLPDAAAPLNPAPLTAPEFERQGVVFGTEQCFVVRTVQMMGAVALESSPSERVCTTPSDQFPPAAPRGLSAVAGTGVISLIWDANTEPDLAGYIVLRGEAPGDTLQPLTPAAIRETTFRDTTVKPGVRYVYAIVAVDTAKPPNTSAQSARVEETAR